MTVPELHVISTGRQALREYVALAAGMERFVDRFHVREKSRSPEELCEWIAAMRDAGIPLSKIVVNGQAGVAWSMKAAGVQLGAGSLPVPEVKRRFPGLRIGRSVHSPEEAAAAERDGADCVIYGNVYETASKPGLPGRGTMELKNIASRLAIPVIAVGGITPQRVREVMNAGAAGVAVISGIWEAPDPVEAAGVYAAMLRGEESKRYAES